MLVDPPLPTSSAFFKSGHTKAQFSDELYHGGTQSNLPFTETLCTIIINFQASCIDSTAQPEAVFASEVKKLQADKLKPQEQITLEPYERDHAVVVGVYRPPPKSKGG
jgi:hypothetical protein